MVIVQISDTHISLDAPQGEQRRDDLRRTIAAINHLDPQPDAVIHTGDLANRGKAEEYAAASTLLQTLRAPLYLAVGNRDDRARLQAAFVTQDCFPDGEPFVQYAVEEYAVRLLVLDTQGSGRVGDYCERRAAGLFKALRQQPDKPVAVFLHHPPFDIPGADEAYKFQFESREAAERLTDVLARFEQVVQIFCGHAHRATQVQMNGIPASSMASIAVDLRVGESAQAPSSAPRFQIHRYVAGQGFETLSQEVVA
jgi:Icc protein